MTGTEESETAQQPPSGEGADNPATFTLKWLTKRYGRKAVAASTAIILGSLTGGASLDHFLLNSDSNKSTDQITIASPIPGASVARCTLVSGTVRMAGDEQVLILVQGENPTTFYLEGMAKITPTEDQSVSDWSFTATFGGTTSKSPFSVYAVVLKPEMAKFLVNMRDASAEHSNIGGLTNSLLPPDTTAEINRDVQRQGDTSAQCG